MRELPRDITRDPRESETWFLNLPTEKRQGMREAWAVEGSRFVRRFERQSTWRWRCWRDCFLVILPTCFLTGSWTLMFGALVAGPAGGELMLRTSAGRFSSAAISFAATFVASLISGFLSAGRPGRGFVYTLVGAVLAGALGAAFGLRRELNAAEQV